MKPLSNARRRSLAKAMQVRAAPYLEPDSMRQTATISYPVRRMDGPDDALEAQIGYMSLHLRFLEWTKKCTRKQLKYLTMRIEEVEQPFALVSGRIVDVRFCDDWDPASPVSRICLMAPRAYNERTDELEYIDSHIWLRAWQMRLVPEFPLAAESLHIGDMVAIAGEVVPYKGDSDIEGRRYGIGEWALANVQFDYSMHGVPWVLEDRTWLGATVGKLVSDGAEQKCRFARRGELKDELDSLRHRAIALEPLKRLVKEEDCKTATLEEALERYMEIEEQKQKGPITIEANRAMRRKLNLV